MINTSTLFGGAAVMGLLAGFWQHVKIFLSKLIGLLIIRCKIKTYGITEAFIKLLLKEFKCSNVGTKMFFGQYINIIPLDKNGLVAFESLPPEPTIWWKGFRPLLVTARALDEANITFIRGTFNAKKLLGKAVGEFGKYMESENQKADRFFVRQMHGSVGEKETTNQGIVPKPNFTGAEVTPASDSSSFFDYRFSTPVNWEKHEIGPPDTSEKNFMDFYEKNDSHELIINEINIWKKNEKWFKDRNITWKRGYVFYGKTGGGKTAFVRALGQKFNMPIFSFDLSTMTNRDFYSNWQNMLSASPAIALIEDIDSVFDMRKNIATSQMNQGLSFDYFLNVIDGVAANDGVILIITTNNLDKIDPALGINSNGNEMSTRPGRTDRVIEFVPISFKAKQRMAKRILGEFKEEFWRDIIDNAKDSDTGAQFQEKCVRRANELFWRNIEKMGA